MELTRYWKVYEVDPKHPDYRMYAGIFVATSAEQACQRCLTYTRERTLWAIRDTLEAEEVRDERLHEYATRTD